LVAVALSRRETDSQAESFLLAKQVLVAARPLLVIVLAGLAPAASAHAASYARPKGASPLNVSLVLAFNRCDTASSGHGAPLAYPSCAPPTRTTRLGVGPNSQFTGRYSLSVITGFPGPPDDSDVAIKASLTDVRCLAAPPTPDCDTTSNLGTGPDYLGDLDANAGFRITDASGGLPATVEDFPASAAVACTGTPSSGFGSSCDGNTSMNALTPGAVKDGQRQIIQVGQVRIADDDGNLYADQGVFVP
jgi:hypothetical protein